MRTQDWLTHFQTNQSNILAVAEDSHILTAAERERITQSIQSFQLGESSEGSTLRAQARAYRDYSARSCYLAAVDHLIQEENRHSAYLLQFMRMHRIPQIKRGFNDACFRFLRRLAGIEWAARVLVIAETIALTYYRCLSEATDSPVLKQICARMRQEEMPHVQFQMHHIHEMNFKKHGLWSSLANIAHFGLLLGTLCFVWFEHRRVLSPCLTFSQFIKAVWADFAEAMWQGQVSAIHALVEDKFLSPEVLCTLDLA